jgi:hypothetical protein
VLISAPVEVLAAIRCNLDRHRTKFEATCL